MEKLFGTDGIRGKADRFPLDNETVSKIGRSLAVYFKNSKGQTPKFVIGRDTRESGPRIENAIYTGARSGGAECDSAGVITTPGIAYLTNYEGYDAGIVISASHNPFEDNGIKIFSPDGKKLPGRIEELIEMDISEDKSQLGELLKIDASSEDRYRDKYIAHFEEDFGHIDLTGIKMVLDCANGAASDIAPTVFADLGANVVSIHNAPDGRNINRDCGSLHLDDLRERVLQEQADIGVAFDGDADRSLFIDENGSDIDGDATLWIMANHLKKGGRLKHGAVVATVMSNIGLEKALAGISVSMHRASVGDKYVLEQLLNEDLSVGGEQSGHIIFPDRSLVGDGIQTALFLLEAMHSTQSALSNLVAGFERFPQILINVPVKRKLPFEEVEEISELAKLVEKELAGEGRLLLRYSGTENLARVMIEGSESEKIENQANRLAKVIEKSLGV